MGLSLRILVLARTSRLLTKGTGPRHAGGQAVLYTKVAQPVWLQNLKVQLARIALRQTWETYNPARNAV
jgi:hypothetical protein